ncbi:hypothetical protein ACI4AF_28495, partial [Klebsiella pneumoniae]|uniref:hypothetical protein n=1 Tax=Klebsiella pneumoniae TaxID=573 RepID=UPI003854FAAD
FGKRDDGERPDGVPGLGLGHRPVVHPLKQGTIRSILSLKSGATLVRCRSRHKAATIRDEELMP